MSLRTRLRSTPWAEPDSAPIRIPSSKEEVGESRARAFAQDRHCLARSSAPLHRTGMAAKPPLQPQQLAPEWLAHRYDPEHDAVHLVRADRALRRSVPFLTDEHLPSAQEPVVARREDALESAPAPSPVHFVFHSA